MTDGLRLAALKLHGVGAADRDWILDRLSRRERRALVVLLRDLKRTGIGAASFDALGTEAAGNEAAAPAEPIAPDVPAELVQADAEAVARALQGEPEWVRSALLAMHPWKWRRAVLERIAPAAADPAGRTPPVLGASRDAPRPALAAALARSLARRVAEPAPAAARSSRFERVMDNLDPLARAPRARVWERLRKWIA
jgi:hypothetical protein